jgi:7-cyano-7-deazaguanine synthase
MGLEQFPLFVDYHQRALGRELLSCKRAMQSLGLPGPKVVRLGGYGRLIKSGLTDSTLDVVRDAFTPGRNLLFLLMGASYAVQVGAGAVAIGLLHEETSLFPDQTAKFLTTAENMLTLTMGRTIKVLAPLAQFHKQEVVSLAMQKGIRRTYSCHRGGSRPCGKCISCKEFEERDRGRK